MPFQIKYMQGIDTVRIAEPERQHFIEAYRMLRRGELEIVDLIDMQSRAWLQLVTFDQGKNVGLVAAAATGGGEVLYSKSADLVIDDILPICEAFIRAGDVLASGFAFSRIQWEERDAPVPSKPPALAAVVPEAVVEPDQEQDEEQENPELSPQDMVDEWIKYPGQLDDETIRLALSTGASLSPFVETPALIHLASCGAHPDVIDFVMSRGADISAVHEGGTALWHAVSAGRYAFANALVLRGADVAEAQSSVNFKAWRKRDAARGIIDAIASGDESAVLAYLASRTPRNIGFDLIVQAIKSERLAILLSLLAGKGELTLMSGGLDSAWSLAMGLSDARYIEALVQYGAYEIVSSQRDYARRVRSSACRATLSFLFSNGYTHAIEAIFSSLIRFGSDRCQALLPVYPDSYFVGLPPEQVVIALISFSEHAPERIDHLMDHNDYAALVHHVFDGSSNDALRVGPLILGGHSPANSPSLWCKRIPRAVWEQYCELRAVAGGLVDLDITVSMPDYARRQQFNHHRRQYEILSEAVRDGVMDEESVTYDIAAKFINHGYGSLTDVQKQVFDEQVAHLFENLSIRPCHWFLDDMPRHIGGQ